MLALNLKWDPTNDLHFNFDGQYVNSKVDNYDISIEATRSRTSASMRPGALPRITLAPPTNINQSAGGLANPDNWYCGRSWTTSRTAAGHEYALRGDGD